MIKSRRMRWEGHVARMGIRGKRRLLVGKPNGKRPLGRRPRCRWVYNIKMARGEIGWSDVDWIGLARYRGRWRALVNTTKDLGVP
jgi:hypothetical protein